MVSHGVICCILSSDHFESVYFDSEACAMASVLADSKLWFSPCLPF